MLPHSWLTSLLLRRPLKRRDSKSETSNNAVAPQALDFTGGDAEPVVQNFRAVLPKRRRSFQPYCLAVDPHRPGRHLVVAVVVMDGLHDAAFLEARLVLQFHRVEHGAGRHPDGNEFLHCLALVVLARPFADDRVELPFVRDTVIAGRKTRVLNQFLTADQLHQPRPVLRVGPAGGQVDIVVGATALGRVKHRGSVVAAARFGAVAPRRFAGARHIRETRAHVVDHRILHRHLQPAALAGAIALVQGAEDGGCHQHTRAGVPKAQARFDRRAVGLAGDADWAPGSLRDHVEGEPLLVRATTAEALDLAIDDAGVELFDRFVIETEALDRARRHVFDRDIGLFQHFLDDIEALRRFQIYRQRLLVDVELVKIPGVVVGLTRAQPAARIAPPWVLDLDHLGAEPGEHLGRGGTRLELGEIHHLDALQKVELLGDVTHHYSSVYAPIRNRACALPGLVATPFLQHLQAKDAGFSQPTDI